MKAIETTFKSDTLELFGTLHLPAQPAPPLVVGSHGLEGSQNSAKQRTLARILPEAGIAFFRFDHRGCGRSQGDFIQDTSLEKRSRDILAAVHHVRSMAQTSGKLALFGSSIGGAACIHAWDLLKQSGVSPAGAVLCASPVMSTTIVNIPTQATDQRPALPLRFFKDNLLFDLSQSAAGLHHLLIFHGDADEVVPVSNARLLHRLAGDPKELIIHKNGRHRMDALPDQKDFEHRATAWYTQILSPPPKSASTS